MENLLSIDYSLELTEGTHDFISVDARISGSPISNPDIWTPIESIEFSTKELIKTLQAQNNIPKKNNIRITLIERRKNVSSNP